MLIHLVRKAFDGTYVQVPQMIRERSIAEIISTNHELSLDQEFEIWYAQWKTSGKQLKHRHFTTP